MATTLTLDDGSDAHVPAPLSPGQSIPSIAPSQSTSEATFETITNSSGGANKFVWKTMPFGSGVMVPSRYSIPTHILGEIFRTLDRRDSPAQLGRLRFETIKDAILRFHEVLADEDNAVDSCIRRLKEQAERRRHHISAPRIEEVTLRWDQGFILDCFQVKLGLMERIFFTFDISENSTLASKGVTLITMLAVLVSIFTFILGTTPNSEKNFGGWIPWVDVVCVSIFTFDYTARFFTVPFARIQMLNRGFLEDVILGQQDRKLLTERQRLIKFLLSPMGFVDLVSVIPFWIELGIAGVDGLVEEGNDSGATSGTLRIFRIVRLARVFKLGTLTKADMGEEGNMVLHLFKHVLSKAKPALNLVIVLVLVAMLVFGTLIWAAERGDFFEQGSPDCPVQGLCSVSSVRLRKLSDGSYEQSASPFESVPLSFWWVIVTITTVGYGDYYPVTSIGYVIGGITILYGVIVFALPVGIIGTAFSQAYDQFLNEQTLRKRLEDCEEDTVDASAGLASLAKKDIDPDQLPPLVLEFIVSLQQSSVALALSPELQQRWEESLRRVTNFENIMLKHPCDSLETWGTPVLTTLSQLVLAQPMCTPFYNQTRSAWNRLLLHTSQSYEEFYTTMDRSVFHAAMHSSIKFGQVKTAHEVVERTSTSLTATTFKEMWSRGTDKTNKTA